MTKGLRINGTRLNATLQKTCTAFGAAHKYGKLDSQTGMQRMALSKEDKGMRDWLVNETKSLGCKVIIDEMGNIFSILPGKKQGAPTGTGSHLDTVFTGGRYDGILGVQAGLEVLRTLVDNQYVPEYPIALIDWTNEEGARFPISMVSSAVWSGDIPLKTAYELQDVHDPSKTILSCLEEIGYKGTVPCSHKSTPLKAHFELHIEQGPILETHKQKVGIVKSVQAFNWYEITVKGKPAHTGTTPFYLRSDAMLGVAKMILASNEIAKKHGGLASTGIVNTDPGAVNVMPESVMFSLDIRAELDEVLEKIDSEIRTAFDDICNDASLTGGAAGGGISVSFKSLIPSPAVHFHPDCVKAVTDAAEEAVGKDLTRVMVSGAGHDSCYTAKICPTSMIFVPSKNGLSHNPLEYTSPEDCALGAQVLLDAILSYDASRKD